MLDVERVKLAGSIDDVTLTEMNTVAWFACLDLLSCNKHAMWLGMSVKMDYYFVGKDTPKRIPKNVKVQRIALQCY